ncbi:hypothetical protein DFP94_101915 [Fontibacillus phaseoli]|uniref:Multi-TM2 domain-containing protein n=1 Tax=Fontibacillus phaseoli TaxID=1416533 RepID=A0A369BRL8_9BACL|nr:hypothetical protein [Fontibacillus phaseoli]RCX23318.1 hypothetical protein DFP94_101915 [Fontibacillus phaseoli]
MTYYRSRMLAFILNFIPGLGHFYWGRKARGIFYPIFFFGGLFGGFLVAMAADAGEFFLAVGIAELILWGISMLDLLIVMLREPAAQERSPYDPQGGRRRGDAETERFFTILLSFIPGLGHFQMGLMQRGLSFLIMFFGLITMMFFVTGITHETVFLLFLALLPIIWLYCMFDAVQLIHRKQAGEIIEDRSLLDEWESGRIEGRRSKVLATLLSAFPGAGQMYLGMQKRGLQLMVLFLGSFYVIDVLRLSLFLFLVPVIWFYSFFDGLQQTSRYGILPMEDIPLIKSRNNGSSQHWLGIVLVLLGVYYVSMEFIVPALDRWFPYLQLRYMIREYLRPILVSVILIGGGIKLLSGRNRVQELKWDDEEI